MISILKNIALPPSATFSQTSSVGEPSLATSAGRIFFSGNWYATESTDNGQSWSFISPENHLPPPLSGGFCCDQTVIYDKSRDIFAWILQYIENGSENVMRVAIKKGNDDNNAWYWWDFIPADVNGAWTNEWFDYNHIALSDNYLYVGSNTFSTVGEGSWKRYVLLRLPLDDLAQGSNLNFNYFQTENYFSLRCVQGATSTMYFAAHQNTRKLRVFSWDESSTQVQQRDVTIARWSDVNPSTGGYSSKCPDNTDWLARCDSRITGGWYANGVIGFLWTANRRGKRPHPHVRVVRINTSNFKVLSQPDIWNAGYAYAYPDVTPNDNGDVGLILFRAGGSKFPNLVAGHFNESTKRWNLKSIQQGTHGPSDKKWGDYVACRKHSDGITWVGAGFTLEGGNTRDFIVPRYVRFEKAPET